MNSIQIRTFLAATLPMLVAFVAIPSLSGAEEAPVAAADGTLRVEVLNIQNDQGQIGCSLFVKPDGFPSDAKKALKAMFVNPKNKKATCTFSGIKPGTYAVSIMHDLDKSGDLETNLVGRPKEPWGVSNDAPAERFGPPKFEAASFKYTGKPTSMTIKLHE